MVQSPTALNLSGNNQMPLLYPVTMTQALEDVLGIEPGLTIHMAGALRECGRTIQSRYEAENAAVRHFLIPFALRHSQRWKEEAMKALIEMRRRHDAGKAT